jgi:hypothetical protein
MSVRRSAHSSVSMVIVHRLRSVATAAALTLIGCQLSSSSGPCPDGGPTPCVADGLRVLFIGNSLTYGNDVPALVRALSEQAEGPTLRTAMVAFPDYSLDDHWSRGSAQDALRTARWDVVVLQQGPSSLPENRALLIAASERFAPLIRAAGARIVLYEVWPTRARRGDAVAAQQSYREAARAVGGSVAPAGTAWTVALATNPALALYDVDGLHASLPGSLLAALTLHARITTRDVAPTGALPELAGDTALPNQLRRAARRALVDVAP